MDLTHKHELKSKNKNALKAQIQKYKTALKLKQATKARKNQHNLELMTLWKKHDLKKLNWNQKFKMTQTKQYAPIEISRRLNYNKNRTSHTIRNLNTIEFRSSRTN